MNEDTIQNLIADVRNWEANAKKNSTDPKLVEVASALYPVLDSIATRLECLVKDGFYVAPESINKFAREEIAADVPPADTPIDPTAPTLNQILANPPFPELTASVVRTRIVVTPNGAAMKYDPLDDGLPRLSAHIETVADPDGGKASQACTIYVGGEVLADMTIYRGKHLAVRMVKQALKGAMSRLGKGRRMAANRRAREAAQGKEAE